MKALFVGAKLGEPGRGEVGRFKVGWGRGRERLTLGTDAHLVLGVVLEETLNTTAWEL